MTLMHCMQMAARETGIGAVETYMHAGKLLALELLVKVLENQSHSWSHVRQEVLTPRHPCHVKFCPLSPLFDSTVVWLLHLCCFWVLSGAIHWLSHSKCLLLMSSACICELQDAICRLSQSSVPCKSPMLSFAFWLFFFFHRKEWVIADSILSMLDDWLDQLSSSA